MIPGLERSPGEGHGNPLQYSCLENLRDGGAWWAAVYGVAQIRTRVKRLTSSSAAYWASLVVRLVKNPPAMQETWFHSWVRKMPWRRDRLPTPGLLGFHGGSDCKEAACNARDLGLIPGLERSPGEGHGNPLKCLAWRIPMEEELDRL